MPSIGEWIQKYGSTNASVRLRAAKAMLDRSDEVPLNLLIDILVKLSHHGLGRNAQQVLESRQDSELFEKMIELLESNDSFVRETACSVLGRSGDVRATAPLIRMVEDTHIMVRRAAGFGLAHLKDRSAIEQVRVLCDKHRSDNANVVMALQSALQSLTESKDSEVN